MTIVKVKSGKYTYLYENISYRNENGKPCNHRTCIGKIDPKTGHEIYNETYLEKKKSAGTPILPSDDEPQYSVNDVKKSVQKECGLAFLLHRIAEQTGLLNAISENAILFAKFYTKFYFHPAFYRIVFK